ncbi:MAG: MBL fold metallo-hydrolase [Acidobacteriota bacterium]
MRLAVLGSGSSGNSVVIESNHGRLMLDAGFTCRQLSLRLGALNRTPDGIDALLLTHEHRDHTQGADVLLRRHGLPFFATRGTLEGSRLPPKLRERGRVVRSGVRFEVAGFQVEPFGIPHDAREPVGFVVEDREGRRVGLASDIGYRSQLAWAKLRDLDALILETNHDVHMLRTGPYPWVLKQRVAGRRGHLSNEEASQGLADLVSERLRYVVAYHLSRTNNLPALVAQEIGERLDALGSNAQVVVSSQTEPTSWLDIP